MGGGIVRRAGALRYPCTLLTGYRSPAMLAPFQLSLATPLMRSGTTIRLNEQSIRSPFKLERR